MELCNCCENHALICTVSIIRVLNSPLCLLTVLFLIFQTRVEMSSMGSSSGELNLGC